MIFTVSLAPTAQALTVQERLAEQSRTQADLLKQQGANQAVVDALRDRADALRDGAEDTNTAERATQANIQSQE